MPSYVVVGASRGLGYEWLRQLSSDPTNTVIGLARTPKNVQERLATDKISNVHLIQGDMSDNASLIAAAEEAGKLTGGSLDYLIVNGVSVNYEEHFLSPTDYIGKEDLLTTSMLDSVKVNLIGVIFTINAFLPLVRKSSIKKITVISTGFADRDLAEKSTISFAVTYSSIKAALNVVVAKYAAELKGEGIIFLALSPGVVDTSADKPKQSTEMSPYVKEKVGIMMTDFKRIYPDWVAVPLTPTRSVEMQKGVIDEMTIEKTGAFLSHHGNKNWL
ncbi:hypothetical protein G7Y89_g10481 [Cudoniella acicularis]|uniref:NAD(P)-binding protein n=1 Tax=Cudoniella acicularis TaxID=354080 RepID=A0A8H4VYQ3_9HELO|nr:hypothetical protein G7Y89_g10481 [Cudoniella acicularis]